MAHTWKDSERYGGERRTDAEWRGKGRRSTRGKRAQDVRSE